MVLITQWNGSHHVVRKKKRFKAIGGGQKTRAWKEKFCACGKRMKFEARKQEEVLQAEVSRELPGDKSL